MTPDQHTEDKMKLIEKILEDKPTENQEEIKQELFDIIETNLFLEIARLAEYADRLRQARSKNGLFIRVIHDFQAISKLAELQQIFTKKD
jgi:hypothetical protein